VALEEFDAASSLRWKEFRAGAFYFSSGRWRAHAYCAQMLPPGLAFFPDFTHRLRAGLTYAAASAAVVEWRII
jgi:hypothetical protein